jgi:hypothetical protein
MSITPGSTVFPEDFPTKPAGQTVDGLSVFTTSTTSQDIVSAGANTAGVIVHDVFCGTTGNQFAVGTGTSVTTTEIVCPNGTDIFGAKLPALFPAGERVYFASNGGSATRWVIYEVL